LTGDNAGTCSFVAVLLIVQYAVDSLDQVE